MSNEQVKYIRNIYKEKILVKVLQILLIIVFLSSWELLVKYNVINGFIYSSPSKIINTIYELYINNNLFIHIYVTLKEIFISFILSMIISFILALILYENRLLELVLDPFLTMLNSLPKIALGPLIIIIFGANIRSVIIMSLLISSIVSLITIYNGFINTDIYKLKLLKSFKSSKIQILKLLVIPGSLRTIITSFKLNISLTLIGVIMGEFLVSKEGIGYLIVYGKQVFNLDYVMSGIVILSIISYIIYKLIIIVESKLLKNI
jgi:NitT/TauT family transport system permease protein